MTTDWKKLVETAERARDANRAKQLLLSTPSTTVVNISVSAAFGHGTPEAVRVLNEVLPRLLNKDALISAAVEQCDRITNNACEEMFRFLEEGK